MTHMMDWLAIHGLGIVILLQGGLWLVEILHRRWYQKEADRYRDLWLESRTEANHLRQQLTGRE